jgi:hypothetical protein
MVVGSFPNNTIPDDLSSPVNGTMYISTIGWTQRSVTYLLAVLPITTITIFTFSCALYSIFKARTDQSGNKIAFDASNILHLIMASVAGGLTLQDFDRDGILANEGMKVKIHDDGAQKLFVTDNQPGLVPSKEKLV